MLFRMDIISYLDSENGASAADLARKIGISPVLISQWKLGVRPIPAERCIDIERATDGLVTCEELRPDLSERWAYLRGTEQKAA